MVKQIFTVALGILFVLHVAEADVPHFVEPIQNLTVMVGDEARFSCVVDNLGNYSMAWVRSETDYFLAIKTMSIVTGPKISASSSPDNQTWYLRINDVQLTDNGEYECRVNTDPPLSISGYLHVVDPSTTTFPETTTSADLVRTTSTDTIPCSTTPTTSTSSILGTDSLATNVLDRLCREDRVLEYRIREAGAAARAAEIEEETARMALQVVTMKLEVEKITLEAAKSGARAEASRSRAEEARALKAEGELQSERERRSKSLHH